MELSEYVAANLEKMLKEHFRKEFGELYTQKTVLDGLNKKIVISQSVLSKLLNSTYQITSSDNKVFRSIAVYLEVDPESLWNTVSEGFGQLVNRAGVIRLGVPTSATFTAPLLNAIFDEFPDWLELAHKHAKKDIFDPKFVNKSDYTEDLIDAETREKPESGTFSDCYLSGDLPQLLRHEKKLHDPKRFFDAILCPDEVIRKKSINVGPEIILSEDGNRIIKVATITNGFSGLACLFEKRLKKSLTEEDLQPDVDIKNYHIQYVPKDFVPNELSEEETSAIEKYKNKYLNAFLGELEKGNKDAEFRIYGFASSASFKTFKDFLEENFKKGTGDKERDKLIQKLYTHSIEPINFNTDDNSKYKEIAEAVRKGNKLLLVGYSPYMHNTWQLVSEHFKPGPEEYIHLTRFNFSQWLGKNSFSLYLSKSSCNRETAKKLHWLLKRILQKWDEIEGNMKLARFFFYNRERKNDREVQNLYFRACAEMGLTNKNNQNFIVNYSQEFMHYLMELESEEE